MAKNYENFTEGERREERLDRFRTRESWDRSTTEKRFLFTTAVTMAAGIEQLEDSLVAVSELTQEAGSQWHGVGRHGAGFSLQLRKHAAISHHAGPLAGLQQHGGSRDGIWPQPSCGERYGMGHGSTADTR